MKTRPSFALRSLIAPSKSREKIENWFIIATLAVTLILTISDALTDIAEGEGWLHLAGEGLIMLFSFGGIIALWRRKISLDHEVSRQKKLTASAHAEALKWRKEAGSAIKGLSDAIDAQLNRWQLTKAEKEVALLLLKGLSLKEIASIRSVSEKTARAQSFAVYAKSGLSGRAELSAFFLEDLMLPTESLESSSFSSSLDFS